jgi:ABC-2 type transport system permease protein
VLTLIYPIILAFTGNLPIAETISCYIGFILLCAAILAIGAFMSSLTESQIVAAVATYGVLIFTLLLGSLASNVSSSALEAVLLWLSPVRRFSDFTLGILSFEPIIYYISITGLFLFFTVMVLEKRRLR